MASDTKPPETILTANLNIHGDPGATVKNDLMAPNREETAPITAVKGNYGWKFWLIITSLSITSLLTAIEGTVTSTALPSIANSLDSRELYVWFVNAIFLSR